MVMRALVLAAAALGAVLVTAACGSHSAGSHPSGTHPAAASHSQVAKALVRDCEAMVKSLARGSGGATPTRYKSTVDHFVAELTALADRDGNTQEAAALRRTAADYSSYAADIGALTVAEYHSVTFLTRQPVKGHLHRIIRDGQILKHRYGLVCIPAGG